MLAPLPKLRPPPRVSGTPDGAPASDVLDAPELAATFGRERRIVCAACGGQVTTAAERREVNGRHLHERVNPEGLRFELACFAAAPGAAAIGAPSPVWTWFPGYTWQVALCRSCGVHLGWAYRSDADEFCGLITDRIEERGSPTPGA